MAAFTTSIGFNFRESLNALDDAGNVAVYPISNPAYSSAAGYGYSATGPGTGADYNFSTVTDVRLAGCHEVNNSAGSKKFRIDVNPGSVINLHLALGRKGSGQTQYFRVLDDAAVLATVSAGAISGSSQFMDAAGTVHSSDTNWIANNVPIEVTVTSGILVFEWGNPAGGTSGQSSIAHAYLDFVSTGGGGTTEEQAVAGSLTPSGALATEVIEGGDQTLALAGSLTPTGALSEITVAADTMEGVLTPTGALATLAQRTTREQALTGVLTPAGALVLGPRRIVTGALTPAGALTTRTTVTETQAVAGGITLAGVVVTRLNAETDDGRRRRRRRGLVAALYQ